MATSIGGCDFQNVDPEPENNLEKDASNWKSSEGLKERPV